MKRIVTAIFGVALLAFATTSFAQVSVFCGNAKVTLGGRLSAAAASSSRTLVVHGTCTENVTVRNLRVNIDLGTFGGSIVALVGTTPAITFTGGTTDSTITGGSIVNGGTGGAVVVDRNASVTIQGVVIVGAGDMVAVRRGGLATLNSNLISGTNPAAGRGIRIRNQAFMTLGTSASLNTIQNVQRGITCREGSVVTGVSGNTGLATFNTVTTTNDGVPLVAGDPVTAGGATSCFSDL